MKNGTDRKILIIFDLDNTILDDTADYSVLNLIPSSAVYSIKESYKNWAKYMQQAFIILKEHSIELDQIKSAVQSVPLTEGFREIFEVIRSNKEKFEVLIVSGANTLYLKWIVECYKLHDVVDCCISNQAEPHEDLLIKIIPHHEHNCEVCEMSLDICKKKVLKEYFDRKKIEDFEEHYSKLIYVGDGENDFCPSTLLTHNHLLFPRKDFSLYKMIYSQKYSHKLKCNVHPWKTGYNILEILKKLL